MYKIFFPFLFLMFQFSLSAQILEFDQLEMRYDQKQYRSVYRKANRLIDNPVYDFSFVPRYYLALSKLQLAQNDKWRKRNKYAVDEAKEVFKELKLTHEGREILRAHQYELSVLKGDLTQWMYELNLSGDRKTFNQIEDLVQTIFSDIPEASDMKEDHIEIEEVVVDAITSISKQREDMIKLSNDLIGIPYKWAGNTPKGFDCSGFTCYVYEKGVNHSLKRTAAEQYKHAAKVKRKNVQPGDLVFFDNGSGISHVGIVYSTNNNSIQMIHASTSIGISIVDIYQSSYWKQRIAGFGTYFKD